MRRHLRYRGGDPDRHSFSLVVVGAIVVIAGAVFLGFQWGRYVERNAPKDASPGAGAVRGAGKDNDIRDASASAIRNEMSSFSREAVKIPAVDPPPPPPSAGEDLKKTETDATFPDTLSRKDASPVTLGGKKENPGPPEAAGAGKYRLQAGAWKSRGAAESVRKRLAGNGYSAKVIRAVNRNRGEVFRVRVGPFATREEAEKAGKAIRSKLHVDVILLAN
jgi:cell division protein FtsN